MSLGNTLKGLAACGNLFLFVRSTCFFGSLFVPIKRFDPGDGFFSQWVMAVAIFLVGVIINAYEGFPQFYPLPMLGGAFWTLGNAIAIPIFQLIGMGMALLIWSIAICMMGWASSRFGLFGLKENMPNNVVLNYSGLLLTLFGGIVLSLFACLFYGLTFVPAIYVQEHPDQFAGGSPEALPHVFAQFTGIFVASTVILIVYAIIKCNKPMVNHQIILPAFTSGAMWAVAQTSWFIANSYIAQSISFPVNSMVSGVVGALWSVIYFKEIYGARNFKILSFAIVITISGAIMIGSSKDL